MKQEVTASVDAKRQPEHLHLRLSRQCDALCDHESELLELFHDIQTYEDIMRGFCVEVLQGEEIAFDELPRLKEEALRGFADAIVALEEVEQRGIAIVRGENTGIRLTSQKERFKAVGDRLRETDVRLIPRSSEKMEGRLLNEFAAFVQMSYGSNELNSLREQSKPIGEKSSVSFTLSDYELRAARDLIVSRRERILQPVVAFDKLSQALAAVHSEAKKRQQVDLQPKLQRLRKIAEACTQAGAIAGADRTEGIDVADPVQLLLRKVEIIERGGQNDFWTDANFRPFINEVLRNARDLIAKYPYEEQLRREKQPIAPSTSVTAEQTENVGGKSRWRRLISALLPK